MKIPLGRDHDGMQPKGDNSRRVRPGKLLMFTIVASARRIRPCKEEVNGRKACFGVEPAPPPTPSADPSLDGENGLSLEVMLGIKKFWARGEKTVRLDGQ